MPRYARSFTALIAALLLATGHVGAAPTKQGQSTSKTPKVWRCAGQTDRPADLVITMEPGKAFYKYTVTAAPVTTPPKFESGALSVVQAQAMGCKRRVIEVRVPSNASSGCADCYPNAEIHVCAGSFSGSKEFEEHCRVPQSSTASSTCKTFKHSVEVYKKASGSGAFNPTALRYFTYRGFIDSSGCRVAAKHLGQIHDTAEVYPNVTPPGSGMDVYRVTSLPEYQDELLDTVIFIEFEKRNR
jgi:hypothetical protein